jgi:hypothetical protein
MKKAFLFLVALVFAITVRAQTNLIARIHFAGADQIYADTNFVAFTNLFCSPEAQALKEQTLDKLTRTPYEFLRARVSNRLGNQAARFRPLLDDLLGREWLLEVRDATNGSPEFVLAVHLNDARAQLWQTNLADALEIWTKLPAEKIQNGWQLKKHLPPDLIRFERIGGWVVLGCGQDELPLNKEIARRILNEKRPVAEEKNDWLSLDLDWPSLARWLSFTDQLNLPETSLRVFPKNGNLRFDGKLLFPQPFSPQLESWRVPTNVIGEPLVSFTAMRGVQSWLEKQNRLKDIRDLLPNQIFIWALGQIPFQSYLAAPVQNATDAIRELDEKLTNKFAAKLETYSLGSLQLATNGTEIDWRGLPFVSPFVQAEREPAGQFLFAGVFPNPPASEPPPPKLFAELNQSNILYYDWEITAERLPQVLNLSQLAFLLASRPQLDENSAAAKWLKHVGPMLGNTITEITQTAPDELTLTRKAPGGLTAIEFVALAHWLEATNFPFDLHLQPLPKKLAVP